MTLPKFTHITPSGLDEALDLLSEKGRKAKVIAGGSDLMVQMKHKTVVPEFVLDIKGLEGIEGISTGERGETLIGALTTLTRISESERIRARFPILARAAGKVLRKELRQRLVQ